MKKTMNIYV